MKTVSTVDISYQIHICFYKKPLIRNSDSYPYIKKLQLVFLCSHLFSISYFLERSWVLSKHLKGLQEPCFEMSRGTYLMIYEISCTGPNSLFLMKRIYVCFLEENDLWHWIENKGSVVTFSALLAAHTIQLFFTHCTREGQYSYLFQPGWNKPLVWVSYKQVFCKWCVITHAQAQLILTSQTLTSPVVNFVPFKIRPPIWSFCLVMSENHWYQISFWF